MYLYVATVNEHPPAGIGPGFRLETWDQGFFFIFCDINKIGNFFAKLVEFTL